MTNNLINLIPEYIPLKLHSMQLIVIYKYMRLHMVKSFLWDLNKVDLLNVNFHCAPSNLKLFFL